MDWLFHPDIREYQAAAEVVKRSQFLAGADEAFAPLLRNLGLAYRSCLEVKLNAPAGATYSVVDSNTGDVYTSPPQGPWTKEPRQFVRSPGWDSPTECWSWLFEQGCEPSNCKVFRGDDGKWRGSGEVTRS